MDEQYEVISNSKLSCFQSFFQKLNISVKELNIKKYPIPLKRWKTIVSYFYSKEKEVDLKLNAIYNVLEIVLEKCESLIEFQEQDKIKDIILSIASLLYEQKFISLKEQEKNESFIIETIKWSSNSSLIRKLTLFTCLYLNASSKVCTLISDIALCDSSKLSQFYVNNKLLSKSFIDEITKNEHEQIIESLLYNKRNIPLLNEDFYKYIRSFCEYDFNYFLVLFRYTPFFLESFENILKVFNLEQLKNMNLEQIRFLCYFRDLNCLIKIKILLNLDIPLKEIEKVLEHPSVFELLTLGLPVSKIDKVIKYPDLINFIYQKIALLKNNKTPQYEEYKSLIKIG